MSGCYICGQPGHVAKECRTTVYNVSETPQEQAQDGTGQWYDQQNGYDPYWYSNDITGYANNQSYAQQQQALPPPQQTQQHLQERSISTLHFVTAVTPSDNSMTTAFINEANSHTEAEIMIDSGAATHVCPPWFAQNSPLYTLQQGQGPSLRTATDEEINMYGYKWVLMANNDNYKIVVPFYVCDVKQPIMSVTRLTKQGFNIQFKDTPTMSHSRGFYSNLVKRSELFYLPMKLVTSQANMKLDISMTGTTGSAAITPVTITPTGMEVVRNRNDTWTFNTQGFRVRTHRTTRKALFVPDSRCPIPTDRLENYRRTIVYRQNGNNEDFEDKYQDLNKSQQKRVLQGPTWTGETWFRVKKGTILPGNRPPQPPAVPSQTFKVPEATSTSASSAQQPLTRHTYKRPIEDTPQQHQRASTTATSIPHPKDVQPTSDYWIREGNMWKRVHIQPGMDLYIPQQNRRWTRHHKTDSTKKNPHQTYGWNKRTCSGRRLDNKETSNIRQRMDRINKLRRTSTVQGRVSSQKTSMNNKKQEKQRAYQHHDNQQSKREWNTNSHTCHTEVGVHYAYKARAEQTTTQSNTAKHQ